MLRYAITDAARRAPTPAARRAALLAAVRRWSSEGIDFIQLRERSLDAGELYDLARLLHRELAETGTRTRLLVNTRADIAVAAGADGVHLTSGPGQLTPAQVRTLHASVTQLAGRPLVVSVSCHTVAEAAQAHQNGADLILFGPVFEKVVGTERALDGTGLALLHEAVLAAGSTPVLALGGITSAAIPACVDAGAAGIAAIRLFA